MAQERKSSIETAQECWGPEVPDWIMALAECCDAKGSQRLAGDVIDYSAAVVNQVIRNRYRRGDLRKVEDKVRGALLGETVSCPVLGVIAKDQCRDNQTRPFAATNAARVRVYHACRNGCPHAKGDSDAE